MASIDSIGATAYTANSATRKANDELGKDAFLQLLVAQLQHQDPLNPAEDTEFIAQLATFSTLEQLQNMNGAMQVSQASALVGKQVTWQEVIDGATQTYYATVECVRVEGSNVYLVVDSAMGKEIKMSQVVLIEDPNASGSIQYGQAAALIDKNVTWYEQDYNGNPVAKSDIVASIKVLSGVVYLVMTEKNPAGGDVIIQLSSVAEIKK